MAPRDPHRRDRLVEAAREQILLHGFRGLRTQDVAKACGVSKGALFLEFPTREALLIEVVQRILSASAARWMARVAAQPRPLLRLRATLRFVFEERAREPVFDRLLKEDPELRMLQSWAEAPDQQRQADAQLAMLGAWLREGVEDGSIRADLPLELVPFVLSLLRFAHDHVDLATGQRAPRDAVLNALVDLFVSGLATEAGRQLLSNPEHSCG